jgi:hypothetical protein
LMIAPPDCNGVPVASLENVPKLSSSSAISRKRS